jgi:hypothetical protein
MDFADVACTDLPTQVLGLRRTNDDYRVCHASQPNQKDAAAREPANLSAQGNGCTRPPQADLWHQDGAKQTLRMRISRCSGRAIHGKKNGCSTTRGEVGGFASGGCLTTLGAETLQTEPKGSVLQLNCGAETMNSACRGFWVM